METVQMKQIWCYNLRGLYYEAGLQAKPGSCRVFFSMLQRYFALGQIITETYPAFLTCSRKQPHALRSQCIKFLITIFAFPPPSSIRNMDSQEQPFSLLFPLLVANSFKASFAPQALVIITTFYDVSSGFEVLILCYLNVFSPYFDFFIILVNCMFNSLRLQ